METIHVSLPGGGYDILTGSGALPAAAGRLRTLCGEARLAVVADPAALALHKETLQAALEAAGVTFCVIELAPGEEHKTLAALAEVYAAFAHNGLGRGDVVAAFGGGVAGDLAGFAAATWMRGVRLVQIPTTLLAQVDASVGGKTAVNLPEGKNLVGAFHQPALVVADTNLLATLPPREVACGMAEVVKMGAICSPELFARLAKAPTAAQWPGLVAEAARLKAGIVQQDETEQALRKILNFGHSFGHAIEALGGYGTYSHGAAVAMGMVLAAGIGVRLGVTPPPVPKALGRALAAQGLPAACPYTAAQMRPLLALDKKRQGEGSIDLVLLQAIGKAVVRRTTLEEALCLAAEVCA